MHGRNEHGFSLVELLVAMVVTTIIAGAIFGMMQVGQNAFRREPELVDRQDNIRMAMNLIERDLANAGMGMGQWTQVFTQNLDGQSTVVGPGGTVVANALSTNGHYNASGNAEQKPDFLEFLSKSGTCPDVDADCNGGGGGGGGGNANSPCNNGAVLTLQQPRPACYPDDSIVFVLWTSGGGKYGVAHNNTGGGGNNWGVNFPQGQATLDACSGGANPAYAICDGSKDLKKGGGAPGDPYGGQPQKIVLMSLIRYEVANDADGTPCLFRSEVGGAANADGTGAIAHAPGAGWQLVARGIEDMQVVYTTLDNAGVAQYSNTPPAVVTDDYRTVVRDVRVTLGARTLAPTGSRLAGQAAGGASNIYATNANAVSAIRGNLTRVVTIPAGLAALHTIDPVGGGQKALYWK